MPKSNSQSGTKPATKQKEKKDLDIKVRINSLRNDDSRVKAYASANISGSFAIHGISVVEGKNGLFMSMPQRSYTDDNGEKKYTDIFHAVTKEAYEAMNTAVLGAYEKALAESQSQSESEDEEIEIIDDESEGLSPSM